LPPDGGALVGRLARSAWQEAEQLLAGRDENREQLLQAWAESPDAVALAAGWVRMRPQSARAQLLMGVSLVGSAWRIRGTTYAGSVDPAAWEPFLKAVFALIEQLERLLLR
jgi:hypothetical protein